MNDPIHPADFREMKAKYGCKTEKLEAKLSGCDHEQVSINHLLDKGLDNFLKLDYIYESGDVEKRREILRSMHPEK